MSLGMSHRLNMHHVGQPCKFESNSLSTPLEPTSSSIFSRLAHASLDSHMEDLAEGVRQKGDFSATALPDVTVISMVQGRW
jgi:hypothetical protein